MSGFSPDHAGAEVRVSPNFGPRARRVASRHDHPALHRHGDGRRRPRRGSAIRNREVSSHYLVHEDGRIVQMVRESDRAWHAGKSSWRGAHRHQLALDRHRDRQSGPCARLSRIFPAADRRGHRALPRHHRPPCDPAAARARAFRRGARPQDRSRREISVAEACRGRRRSFCRAGAAPAAGRCFGPATAAPRSRNCSRCCRSTATASTSPARSIDHDRRCGRCFQRHFRPRRVDGLADRSTVDTLRRLLAGPACRDDLTRRLFRCAQQHRVTLCNPK